MPSSARPFLIVFLAAITRATFATFSSSLSVALLKQLKGARQQLNVLSNSPTLQGPDMYIRHRRNTLEQLQKRLVSAEELKITRCKQRYFTNTAKLDALSPLKVLTRGYALVQNDADEVVRSIKQVHRGDVLSVTMSDGSLKVVAEDVKEKL